MKKFFVRLFVFLAIILILFPIVEIIIRTIPNNYSYKHDYLTANASDIQILSMGSSHGLYAIDPLYFNRKGFNASHVAQSINFDYEIWDKFKASFDNLDTLIIPITFFTLFSNLEDTSEAWRIKNYAIYYGFKENNIKNNLELLNQRPSAILKMIAKRLKGQTNLTISELGANTIFSNQPDLLETGQSAAIRHAKQGFNRLEENVGFIKSMLSDCESMGVSVLLVTTPTTEYYWKNLDKNLLQLMQLTIDNLLQEFPDVKYFNFLKDDRFDLSDFRDADHLNPYGAEKFTKILNTLIE